MSTPKRWTSADLDDLPYEELKRYEIIDGELYVSDLGHLSHQAVVGELVIAFEKWNETIGIGRAIFAPGLIFS